MADGQSREFGEELVPMKDLLGQADKKTSLQLADLQVNDHLRVTFDNVADLDRVSSLVGEFVVEGFDVSFAPRPAAPPIPYLRFVNGTAFPAEYQGRSLEFSGARLGRSSIMMGQLAYDHSIEVRSGDTVTYTPPVSGFAILRPDNDGKLHDIPPNALGCTVYSEEHARAQALLEDVKNFLLGFGIEVDRSDTKTSRSLPGGPHLDGEVVAGTDYAGAYAGEYYVFNSQLETMFVMRQHSEHHIQAAEYRGLSFEKLCQLSDIAISNLYATGAETITYNTSNTQSIFKGGIAYAPNSEDAATKLHLKKATPGTQGILHPPVFSIDSQGGVQISMHDYLYEQDTAARQLVEANSQIERTDQHIKIQLGDKIIYLPTTFSADSLMATLSQIHHTLHRT